MRYQEPVFRPPSEADSYILQITYGCSHNRCSFCGMYKEKPFKTRPFSEILVDITIASKRYPGTRRVFLADGDAMILKADKLIRILDELSEKFRKLERVSIYTDARGINLKSESDLLELKKRKLSLVYLGLESGSDRVLERISKGATAAEMIQAVVQAERLGIKTSVMALLGIAGKDDSEEHSVETARVISAMSPAYFSALTLTLVPGTPLSRDAESGHFLPISPEESLGELARMIALIEPCRPLAFRTNHASNYVPLKGELPVDRDAILDTIRTALETGRLRPEWLRGL